MRRWVPISTVHVRCDNGDTVADDLGVLKVDSAEPVGVDDGVGYVEQDTADRGNSGRGSQWEDC